MSDYLSDFIKRETENEELDRHVDLLCAIRLIRKHNIKNITDMGNFYSIKERDGKFEIKETSQ